MSENIKQVKKCTIYHNCDICGNDQYYDILTYKCHNILGQTDERWFYLCVDSKCLEYFKLLIC